eukprot:CAMPEP_0204899802 /NCGR_PEP_ID=MMETSP1397-20131031/2062_1 /ASSEMBLY_ACC=CAM_ASM_000891 /TAXON_ID=49980 /ORGANISM="Climacostomum Climacostomum virens, Strain Stock W-24" /LENGTH=134 /DNA_ID=CAMNT_0052067803 /DNA_START=516 /DNA_END=916 /DNA_ORIENTATION=-
MSSTSLFVVHDAVVSCKHHVPELSAWEKLANDVLELRKLNIVSRADHSAFVEATNQVDDDFVVSVIVDDLELSNVAMFLHQLEETNDDLAGWTDDHLPLASLLCVNDAFEAVCQQGHHSFPPIDAETWLHWRVR